MRLFVFSPQSTKASESIGEPGDNILCTILGELYMLGYEVIHREVALLPNGKPIPLKRRLGALKKHKESDLTVVFGSETSRKLRGWFPLAEALEVPSPVFFKMDPARILLELVPKIEERKPKENPLYGLNEFNEIG